MGATEVPLSRPLPEEPLEDLPAELRPVARKHGTLWKISYQPQQGAARYVARPRYGGRTVHTDTARLLDRVLTMAQRHLDKIDADPDHTEE